MQNYILLHEFYAYTMRQIMRFLVAEQLYTQSCVSVCLMSVCLMYVPRFVFDATKACKKPGSGKLYCRVQTDEQGTISEKKKTIPHKLRGFLPATSFLIFSYIKILHHQNKGCFCLQCHFLGNFDLI